MVILSSLSFHMFETEAIYSLPFYLLLSKYILGLLARVQNRHRHPLLGKMGEYIADSSFFFPLRHSHTHFTIIIWSLWRNRMENKQKEIK